MKRPEPTTNYLNVDLELCSDADLSPLLKALGPGVFALHSELADGKGFARLEVLETAPPEETIMCFVEAVMSLSSGDRAVWDRCRHRRLSLGIQGGLEPHSTAFVLSNDALHGIAAIQAELEIVVYGANTEPWQGA